MGHRFDARHSTVLLFFLVTASALVLGVPVSRAEEPLFDTAFFSYTVGASPRRS